MTAGCGRKDGEWEKNLHWLALGRHRSGNLIFFLFLESFSPSLFFRERDSLHLNFFYSILFTRNSEHDDDEEATRLLGNRKKSQSILFDCFFSVSRMFNAVLLRRALSIEKLKNFLILIHIFFSLTDIEINLITSFRDLFSSLSRLVPDRTHKECSSSSRLRRLSGDKQVH